MRDTVFLTQLGTMQKYPNLYFNLSACSNEEFLGNDYYTTIGFFDICRFKIELYAGGTFSIVISASAATCSRETGESATLQQNLSYYNKINNNKGTISPL